MTTTAAQRGGHGCTICADPSVEAIDRAITSGLSRSRIAAQYNVSASAVQRHKDAGHVRLDATVTPATEPEVKPSGTAIDTPAEMRAQFKRTLEAVKLARKQGNLNSIADANREHRQTLDAIAKWNIEMEKLEALKAPPQAIRLKDSAEWQYLRTLLFDFLTSNGLTAVRLAIGDMFEQVEQASPEQHRAWYERRKSGHHRFDTTPNKEAHAKPTTDDGRTPGQPTRPDEPRQEQRGPVPRDTPARTRSYSDPIEAI